MSSKPFTEKRDAIKKQHGHLAAAVFESIKVNAVQLAKEDQEEANAEAQREAKRKELLSSDRFAELAKIARHGAQALTLAVAHRPDIRRLHDELRDELDALDASDDQGPEAA